MSEPDELTGEAAVVANKIHAIDRQLNDLERQQRAVIETGLRVAGNWLANLQVEKLDDQHAHLLRERADLVTDLRRLVGDS